MDATQTLSGTSATLPAGSYTVRALRLSDETVMTQEVVLKDGLDGHVTLTFEAALPPATLEAPASGAAGATIDVTWTGPDRDADYIATAVPDAEDGAYLTYEYTAKGNPLPLRLPAQPGSFEIRYVEATTLQVLGRTTIEVTGMDNALSAPAEAPIGSTIPVLWEGAGYSEDYIDIALPGSEPLTYITYAYVSDGNPVEIQVPVKPGAYEIRYITGQDASVFATIPLTVTDVPATLTAPDSVAAGGTLPVSFTGPMNANDYLTIAEQSDGPLGYLTYEYVSGRSEVTLTAPETPGTYALRYIADGPDTAVLVEKTLTVQ
jgi:Ca-activated chloride channel family protein